MHVEHSSRGDGWEHGRSDRWVHPFDTSAISGTIGLIFFQNGSNHLSARESAAIGLRMRREEEFEKYLQCFRDAGQEDMANTLKARGIPRQLRI